MGSSGSFWSNVQGTANPGGRDYCSLRIGTSALFGKSVTVEDLDSISFYSKWESGLNWQIKIYTAIEDGDSSWYRNRFNFDRAAVGSDWVYSSTETLGVSSIYDKQSGGYVPMPYKMSLDDLKSNYGDETIIFIDIIAGYETLSPASSTYLDGVQIAIDGYIANIDLEPCAAVPAPGALLLAGIGTACVGRVRRMVK